MRSLLLAFLPLALTAAGPDDASIRQIIQRYVDVRNHMDETTLRSLFTADADQLVSTGQWRRGLDKLVEGAMASSKKETGHSTVTLESVRLVGSDAAIADGRYETSSTGSSAPRKMWSTFILQRTSAGWRIAAIRNMLPSAH